MIGHKKTIAQDELRGGRTKHALQISQTLVDFLIIAGDLHFLANMARWAVHEQYIV